MRALRISHSAAVAAWRGRERALRARGVDVHLISGPTEAVGGSIVHLEVSADEQVVPARMLGSHPALFIYDPRPIWRALGERWDVIDIHEEPFALATAEILLLRALRRQRAPFILYTAQNLLKHYPVPFRWFERAALRAAAGISACNAEAARISVLKGFPGRPRVIPLGMDPHEFAPVETDGSRRSEGSVRVGYLGRLVPEKGVAVLLDAVAATPGLRAVIGGSGPARATLSAHARVVGVEDRVEFTGPIDPAAVAEFYRGIDVLAIPSLPTARWTEQFGRVAVEAMSAGVPVVSSDAGALPEVVGGAGIVVAHGDAAALADALVAAGGPRAEELRRAGFARAQTCTWDAVGEKYLDLYRSVAGGRPDAGADVEIVVVAYGAPELLRDALEPVAGMPVTVVDNSSLPEIADLCARLGVRHLDPGSNLGFAGGVNLALASRLIPGADVLLLNPDARILPEDLAELHRALRADDRLASVAPAQSDASGAPARVTWPFPSPARALREAIGLGGSTETPPGDSFVVGSVLLLRSEALDQVGPLDDRFFLYSEETDWAFRARLLGWRHAEITTARAFHHGGATSSDLRRREAHFHASQELYYRKHFGALGWSVARTAVWAGSMLRAAVLPDDRGRAARRRAALYRLGPVRIEERLYRGEGSR